MRAIGLNVNGTNGINEYYRPIGRARGGDIERRRVLKKHRCGFVSAFYNSNALQCGFIQFQCGRQMVENRVSKPGGTGPLSFLIRTSGK